MYLLTIFMSSITNRSGCRRRMYTGSSRWWSKRKAPLTAPTITRFDSALETVGLCDVLMHTRAVSCCCLRIWGARFVSSTQGQRLTPTLPSNNPILREPRLSIPSSSFQLLPFFKARTPQRPSERLNSERILYDEQRTAPCTQWVISHHLQQYLSRGRSSRYHSYTHYRPRGTGSSWRSVTAG